MWGSSAGAAISAVVFQVLNALLLWRGISADLGATYSFKGGFEESSGGAAAAVGGTFQGSFQGSSEGGGYNTTPVEAGGDSDRPFVKSGSGYNDFGGA